MPEYVDGFVLPLPKKSLPAYIRMSKKASKIWMDHGALAYRECEGDDFSAAFGLPFPKLVKPKKGEVIMFSWIVFKSRAHRDRVNRAVMTDPRMDEFAKDYPMPFDVKRMAYGGFKTIVSA